MKTRPTDFNNSPLNVGNSQLPKTSKESFISQSQNEICPLRQLIRDWLNSCRAAGLSPKTVDDYRSKMFKFWWWWNDFSGYAKEKGKHPRHVTKREMKEFAAYLREPRSNRWGEPVRPGKEQLSPASIAAVGRTLKVFFNWLVLEDEIDLAPFAGVKFTAGNKDKSRIIKTVSDEQLNKIFSYLMRPDIYESYEGKRNLAIISLLLDSGMRRGELLTIRVQDVDLARHRIRISGKTGERYAHFSQACVGPLREYLKLRERQQAQAESLPKASQMGSKYNGNRGIRPAITVAASQSEQLWLAADGYPLEDYGFASIIRRIKDRTGLREFHAHKLRHTFATKMAASNIDVFALKELMGHQSITTTELYVRQNDEMLADAYRHRSPLSNLDIMAKPERKRKGRPTKQHEEVD